MRQRSTNTVLRHRSQEVRELIPSDQGGVMHTDRALTYDAWALELLAQQKCGPLSFVEKKKCGSGFP